MRKRTSLILGLVFIGGVLVVVCAVLALFGWLRYAPIEGVDPQTATAVAMTAAALPQTPAATFAQTELPRAMTATPQPKTPEQMVFTDSSATQLLKEQIAQSQSEVPILVDSVVFAPEQVTMSGDIDYMGVQGRVQLSGKPIVAENRLRVQLTSLRLDGEDLPDLLYPSVEAEINAYFDEVLQGYDVLGVTLAQGQMTVTLLPW